MKRLLIIGFAGCAFALAPTISASAMPAATPYTLGSANGAVIQVKGGHGMDTGMGGAIMAVAAITMVGTGAATMVGGIIAIAIGGDVFYQPIASCRQSRTFPVRSLSQINRT